MMNYLNKVKYSNKILITGSRGQLGSTLIHHEEARSFEMIALSHRELDISNPSSIHHAITTYHPNLLINTAAYTQVDQAEKEKNLATQTNDHGVRHLAAACKKFKIPLLHFSTDYIFDGLKSSPYSEEDAVNPLNVYGQTKYAGECAIREEWEQHLILRISGVFSEYGSNFLKTILHLSTEKKSFSVVADQITCPTYTKDIADAIFTILKQKLIWGTYHYCSTPPLSWYEFANAILHEAKQYQDFLVEEIETTSKEKYKTLASRPPYSAFNCDKIKKTFGVGQASSQKAIKQVLAQLYEKKL